MKRILAGVFRQKGVGGRGKSWAGALRIESSPLSDAVEGTLILLLRTRYCPHHALLASIVLPSTHRQRSSSFALNNTGPKSQAFAVP
jgi:hypothetical protein